MLAAFSLFGSRDRDRWAGTESSVSWGFSAQWPIPPDCGWDQVPCCRNTRPEDQVWAGSVFSKYVRSPSQHWHTCPRGGLKQEGHVWGTCHGLGCMPCGSGTILEYQTAVDPLSPGVPAVVAFPCSDAASGLSQLHPLQLHSPQPGQPLP